MNSPGKNYCICFSGDGAQPASGSNCAAKNGSHVTVWVETLTTGDMWASSFRKNIESFRKEISEAYRTIATQPRYK